MKYLEQGYEEEFNTLMENLKEKYGQKMFDLDGIGKQLNMSKFSKEFFTTRVTADASVDSNSNVYDNSVISYDVEFAKPFLRYNSYYMLWREMKRLYGQEVSNTIIEHQLSGDIYINDFHGIGSAKPYCNNYSTYDIMMNGLPMIEKPKSLPPKSLYAFKSQVEQFCIIAANSTLGATGLSDLFIVMSYYVDQIFKTGKDAHTYFDGWFSDQEKKMLSEGTHQDIYHDAPTYLHEVDWFEEYTTCHIKRTEPHDKEWFTMNVWRYVRESIASFLYTINQPQM